MNESIPPPPAVKSNTSFWWFVWLLCTVIIPGTVIPLSNALPGLSGSDTVCLAIGVVMLILHIFASLKLSSGSGWLACGLLFGGWILMLASFFVGCVMAMNPGR